MKKGINWAMPRRNVLAAMVAFTSTGGLDSRASATHLDGRRKRIIVNDAGVVLAPGEYFAEDFVFSGRNIRLIAAIPGTVTINIKDGSYLIDRSDMVYAITLDGLCFHGGSGVLRLTNEGPNVTLPVTISRCEFRDYTICAIGNNSNNHPWLRVRDCRFRCADGADAIGIAWGGYADCSIIEANFFANNCYHIKIGPRLSGTIWIRNNDFMMPSSSPKRSDIWLVPNSDDPFGRNSGYGSFIQENKFGNERQRPGAPRVLVAIEDEGTGTDRTTRSHDSRWDTDGSVCGLTISGNRIASIHRAEAPFLKSHIAHFRGLTWTNNKFDGGKYDFAVNFTGDLSSRMGPLNWKVDLSRADGPSLPIFGFCNQEIDERTSGGWE